jgi:hypothetical protein
METKIRSGAQIDINPPIYIHFISAQIVTTQKFNGYLGPDNRITAVSVDTRVFLARDSCKTIKLW